MELDDKQLHFGLVEIKALEFEMSIQENITREKISHHGGVVELDLSDFGYEDELMSAYQNYLGGGMLGADANSCTIEDWEMDEKLVRLASELRDYYDEKDDDEKRQILIELLQIVKITGLKITKKRLKRALLWQGHVEYSVISSQSQKPAFSSCSSCSNARSSASKLPRSWLNFR